MTSCAKAAVLVGGILALVCAPCVLAPDKARKWTLAFPRSRPAAYLLTAIDVLWAAWELFQVSFGGFEYLKPLIFIVTPIAFFLITTYMDELLAARALGAFFLLVPSPLLDAVRWHTSDLRLVIVILSYALVVVGTVLTLSPYLFRKTTNLWIQNDRKCRVLGTIGLAFGVFVALLAFTVFK